MTPSILTSFQQNCPVFTTSLTAIRNGVSHQFDQSASSNDVQLLSPDVAIRAMTSPKTKQNLFREKSFMAFSNWVPMRVRDTNLTEVAKRCSVIGSPDVGINEWKAVSFIDINPVPTGIRSDIYFHGYDMKTLLGHIVSHLRRLQGLFPQGRELGIGIKLHFPLEINVHEVIDFLSPALGNPHVIDNTYIVKSPIKPSIKSAL